MPAEPSIPPPPQALPPPDQSEETLASPAPVVGSVTGVASVAEAGTSASQSWAPSHSSGESEPLVGPSESVAQRGRCRDSVLTVSTASSGAEPDDVEEVVDRRKPGELNTVSGFTWDTLPERHAYVVCKHLLFQYGLFPSLAKNGMRQVLTDSLLKWRSVIVFTNMALKNSSCAIMLEA